MKISNSKKELARIISENGGWRDGAESAAQSSSDNAVSFYLDTASRFCDRWHGKHMIDGDIEQDGLISNWHQTILSREEYFHLYPSQDADGWIEWKGGAAGPVEFGVLVDVKLANGEVINQVPANSGAEWRHCWGDTNIIAYRLRKQEQSKPELCESVMRSIPEPTAKPTIEQQAADYRNAKEYADRKQQEADDARADAEAKLAELVAAGEALGLVVSVAGAEPELVINDWRDLRVGDEVECVDYDTEHRFGVVRSIDKRAASLWVEVLHPNMDVSWPSNWCFIRRP